MGSKKYLIGGSSLPENWVYDEIWSLSFDNVVWTSPTTEIPGINWQKLSVQENLQFFPVKAHSAVQVSETQIFIYGGYNNKKQCTDLSVLFDVVENKIVSFKTTGQKPGPRAYHRMCAVKQNLVCLFGGVSCPEDQIAKNLSQSLLNDFYILNLNEGLWNRPNIGGQVPTARF